MLNLIDTVSQLVHYKHSDINRPKTRVQQPEIEIKLIRNNPCYPLAWAQVRVWLPSRLLVDPEVKGSTLATTN